MKTKILIFVGIVIASTIILGGGISLFLDYSNSTVPIPLNPGKIEMYLKQGCTEEAISFINSNEKSPPSDFSDI